MIELLRRLFSPEYRRAVAAEATGDYLNAARCYAICGNHAKVADMHLARARAESSLDGKVRALRTALDFAPADDPRHAFIARQLADHIRAKAEDLDPHSSAGRTQLAEASALLEKGEAWAEAGQLHLTRGDVDAACRAFGRAGMLERVEQILEQRERDESDARIAHQSFADYRVAMLEGERSRALAALQRCVQHATDKGQYQQLATELSERLPAPGQIELSFSGVHWRFIGALPAVLGRDPDNQIPLRGPSVSRHHARVYRRGGTSIFEIEDAGSRNGTLVDNLVIAGRVKLNHQATVRLGDDLPLLTIRHVSDSPPSLLLEIGDGIDRGKRFVLCPEYVDLPTLVPDATPLRLTFVDGKAQLSSIEHPLQLNGTTVGHPVEPLAGDVVSIGRFTVRVTCV